MNDKIKSHGMGVVSTPNHMFHVYCLCGWHSAADCHTISEASYYFNQHVEGL